MACAGRKVAVTVPIENHRSYPCSDTRDNLCETIFTHIRLLRALSDKKKILFDFLSALERVKNGTIPDRACVNRSVLLQNAW